MSQQQPQQPPAPTEDITDVRERVKESVAHVFVGKESDESEISIS
jgi:hypothetical protein